MPSGPQPSGVAVSVEPTFAVPVTVTVPASTRAGGGGTSAASTTSGASWASLPAATRTV